MMAPSLNSPVCTQDMVNKGWQQGSYWCLNYRNNEQVRYDGCSSHLFFKQYGKRYFFATHQMNTQSLEVSGC